MSPCRHTGTIQKTNDRKIAVNNNRRKEEARAKTPYTEANTQVKKRIRVDKWEYVEDLKTSAEKTDIRQLYYITERLAQK